MDWLKTILKIPVGSAWQRHKLGDWVATHLLTKTSVVDTPHGFRLIAGKFLANTMMQEGSFEAEEIAVARSYLNEVDLLIDVGANIGYYTCLAGIAGKPVLAFEPQPRNLSILYENIQLNQLKDIEVFPLALGATAGTADIYGSSGPSASLLRDWAGYSASYKQKISVNRMDALVGGRLAGKKSLIKIDVEGFEYDVLLGATMTLTNVPKPIWLIEVCLNEFHPGGKNPHFVETFELFFDAGYRVFTADARRIEVLRDDVKKWYGENKSPLGTFDYLMHE